MSEGSLNTMLGQSMLLSMDESDSDDVAPPFLPGGALLETDEGDDGISDGGWLSFARTCAQVKRQTPLMNSKSPANSGIINIRLNTRHC